MADNTVLLGKDGLIYIEVVGVQSEKSVMAMTARVRAIARELRSQKRPVLIFDELTKMASKQPSVVGRTIAKVAKTLDYDRIAMLGRPSNTLLKYGANFLIHGMGRTDTIRYFTSRPEAISWLLSPLEDKA